MSLFQKRDDSVKDQAFLEFMTEEVTKVLLTAFSLLLQQADLLNDLIGPVRPEVIRFRTNRYAPLAALLPRRPASASPFSRTERNNLNRLSSSTSQFFFHSLWR